MWYYFIQMGKMSIQYPGSSKVSISRGSIILGLLSFNIYVNDITTVIP